MIRLFNVYYPVRTLVLLIGEALIVLTSFLLGAFCMLGQDTYLTLYYEYGFLKIIGVTVLVLLCSHWFDLYDTARMNTKGELDSRLLMVPGLLAFLLAAIAYVRPNWLLRSGYSESSSGLRILSYRNPPWPLLSPAPTPVMQMKRRTVAFVMTSISLRVPSESKVVG